MGPDRMAGVPCCPSLRGSFFSLPPPRVAPHHSPVKPERHLAKPRAAPASGALTARPSSAGSWPPISCHQRPTGFSASDIALRHAVPRLASQAAAGKASGRLGVRLLQEGVDHVLGLLRDEVQIRQGGDLGLPAGARASGASRRAASLQSLRCLDFLGWPPPSCPAGHLGAEPTCTRDAACLRSWDCFFSTAMARVRASTDSE